MVEKVLAAVRTGPSRTEMREYPMPEVPDDAALMKMEVGGICGTDVKLYKHPPSNAPVIMGHENCRVIGQLELRTRPFAHPIEGRDVLGAFLAERQHCAL